LAVAAALGGVLGIEPEMYEGVAVRIRDEVNRAAVAAVAAVRPSARDELLAAEAHAAAAAGAGLDLDVGFVNEHKCRTRRARRTRSQSRRPLERLRASLRGLRALRVDRVPYSTGWIE